MLKKVEIQASSFDKLRMRSGDFNDLYCLSRFGCAHREAMGRIVF
jgi:hypothetical protein